MKVYFSTDGFPRLKNAVTTTGSFDGVHLGHQKIIRKLTETAKDLNTESVIITFWPHPRTILSPGVPLKLLTTLEEKIRQISVINPDHLLVIPFTNEFANVTSSEFLEKILGDVVGTGRLVMGYDHRFGKNREGSFEYLKENSFRYGFEVEEITREDIDDITISSTNIRKNLEKGDPEAAAILLGRPYSLSGTVVEGDKLGRKIGYPTANISVKEEFKLIPVDGVYAVEVITGNNNLQGMMNIGFRPTINGREHKLEVNIFDFDKDIYGEQIEVRFIAYLRGEQKFASLEDLKNQISADKLKTQEIFSNKHRS